VSALLDRLGRDFNTLQAERDEIINRAADMGRDLTVAEADRVRVLDTSSGFLSERIIEQRAIEDRKAANVLPDPADPGGTARRPAGLVQVRSEPQIYHPPDAGREAPVFFRDLLHAQIDRDPEARSRIDRHTLQTRTLATTPTAGGVLPPAWLFQEFAILAHGNRPWADQLRRIQIDNANPVNLGQQTAGAAVTVQTEGNPPNDGSFVAGVVTTQPTTLTGKVDVSRQIVDGSMPAIDALVYADAMGSYNEQVETMVVNAFEALAPPVTITYPGTAPVYANLPDAFIDANASLVKHRKLGGSTVFCSSGAWAYLSKQKDGAGRPLITTSFGIPTNSYGVAQPSHLQGEVTGLRVIPSWAGVDNHLYVAVASDLILLESSTFNFRYEEVLGPEAIRLGVWGYCAPILGRYATSTVRINAGTTIPAPIGADVETEAEPAAKGAARK
jgi:HK97 family phage major capsid protein